jgi:uncharacterized alpha-E superfamily protein
MLSRVAENLYWISRYVERAENVARLLDVGFHLELDAAGLADGDGVGPIDGVLAILACREAFERAHGDGPKDGDAVLRFLTFDSQHGQSILTMLARARENARGCQECISGEAWSHINRFYLFLASPGAERRFAASPPRFFDMVKRACILFGGLVDGTLPRSEAFHFIQLGRYLERVNQISRILNIRMNGVVVGEAVPDPPMRVVHWSSLLRSCSAYEAYLREHREAIDPEGVVRYLVLDDAFPRAMRYCISRCLESLREIAGDESGACATEAERRLGRLESELRYLEVGEIFARGLSPFLCGIQDECNQIGAEIHRAFFFT